MSLPTGLLATPPAAPAYYVAYSGGMDSTVLLHLAHAAKLANLSACHIHHGLQLQADAWAQHCQAQCALLGVPLAVIKVAVDDAHRQGPEAAAREVRYSALRTHMVDAGVLLSAHHASDQAETVLLRLLRGTGVEGLAAMAPLSLLGHQQKLWRPLLKVPRSALADYAQQHGLQWIEDPQNQQPRYARSWLRSQVMPLLRERWPEADAQLLHAAEHAADASVLLKQLAQQLLPQVRTDDGGLAITQLLLLSPAQRRLLLRYWLSLQSLPPVSAAILQRLDTEVLAARSDASPLLRWPGAEFRRYRDRLFAGATLAPVPADFCADWDGCAPLLLPAGLGQLSSTQPQAMQLRFAVPGAHIKPAGDAHTRTLSALCQQAGIPPWWRPRLPLIYINQQLVSIAGHWHTSAAPSLRWQGPHIPGLPVNGQQ